MGDQNQIDRAREWTNEHYPNANGEEYEAHFAAALEDIKRIDDAYEVVE